MRTTNDPKIARLRASWLDLEPDDAAWLARVADEFDAVAGTEIVGQRRFVYIVMTGPDTGTMIGAAGPPVTLRSAAKVLVLTVSDMQELARRRRPVSRPVRSRLLTPALQRLAPPQAPPSRP